MLDEVEKAHPEVFNLLLQVMEDGRLTDSQGRVVNFQNCVLIMTSNVGASQIIREQGMGLRSEKQRDESERDYQSMKQSDQRRAETSVFRPEFLKPHRRIDRVPSAHGGEYPADRGTHAHQRPQADEPAGHGNFWSRKRVLDRLAKDGFDPQYGARPLRRAIQRLIEDALSEEVLLGRFTAGDTIVAEMDDEGVNLVFRKLEMPSVADRDPEQITAFESRAKFPPRPIDQESGRGVIKLPGGRRFSFSAITPAGRPISEARRAGSSPPGSMSFERQVGVENRFESLGKLRRREVPVPARCIGPPSSSSSGFAHHARRAVRRAEIQQPPARSSGPALRPAILFSPRNRNCAIEPNLASQHH